MNKLQLKAGMRILVLNPPGRPDEFLKPLPPDTVLVAKGKANMAVAFVRTKAEAHALTTQALKSIPNDALLWLCYPKGGSGVKSEVNRTVLWKELLQYGIRPVTQRALSPVWSAMRFRPIDKVGE